MPDRAAQAVHATSPALLVRGRTDESRQAIPRVGSGFRVCSACAAAVADAQLTESRAESTLGILRTLILAPAIGDFVARRVGVLTGAALIFVITLLSFRRLQVRTVRAAVVVGTLWVACTVLFEVGLGRLVLGYDWARILSDHDLARGLMGLGLAVMLLTPLAVAKTRGLAAASVS